MNQQTALSLLRQYITVHGNWQTAKNGNDIALLTLPNSILEAEAFDKRVVRESDHFNPQTKRAIDEARAEELWAQIQAQEDAA